jgi:acyl carrier protein
MSFHRRKSTILDTTPPGSDKEKSDELVDEVKSSLGMSLQIGERVNAFTENTRLLGDLPELDSMAVLTVILGFEDHFGITVEDDDISAETFETLGNLVDFVRSKLH